MFPTYSCVCTWGLTLFAMSQILTYSYRIIAYAGVYAAFPLRIPMFARRDRPLFTMSQIHTYSYPIIAYASVYTVFSI